MDSIIGYLVALTLSLLSLAGVTTWARVGVDNVRIAATASQMQVFDQAAQHYVQDKGADLVLTATATVPVVVPAQTLVAGSYLPLGFAPVNPFGQTWQLQVLQPSPGQLEALVTAIGGQPISDPKQLVQVAAQAGAQGGFVPYAGQAGDASLVPTSAYGAFGAWSVPLANFQNPGSGHPASLLAFTSVQANSGYLYRLSVPSHPELNAMQTDLSLTGTDAKAHDIKGVNTVGLVTGTATPGADCTSYGNGALAAQADGSGVNLTCVNGQWMITGLPLVPQWGAACSTYGQIGQDNNNSTYVCSWNGTWSFLKDRLGLMVPVLVAPVFDGAVVTRSAFLCPDAGSWTVVAALTATGVVGTNTNGTVIRLLGDATNGYTVSITNSGVPLPNAGGLVFEYCRL